MIKMEESKIINSKILDDYLGDWGILLQEQMDIALDTNYGKKFKWDTATSFECLVDEVDRLNRVIELHDEIVTSNSDLLMFAITYDIKWLPLYLFNKDVLEKLKEMIDEELKEERGY